MPKKLSNALTPLKVKHAKPGRHSDGEGLHLLVKQSGAQSWVYRFMLNGKARDIGLSRCPEALEILQKTGGNDLTLAEAREVASIYRRKVKRQGIDPLTEREDAEKAAARALSGSYYGNTAHKRRKTPRHWGKMAEREEFEDDENLYRLGKDKNKEEFFKDYM